MLLVEEKLDLSMYVPEGSGTGDAVIIGDGILTIADLKYGKGVKVNVGDQFRYYAAGAYHKYEPVYGPFHTIRMVVVQPRLNHVEVVEISTEELLHWAEYTLKPAAQLAWEGRGEFKAGDHCKWCRIRHTCRERANVTLQTIGDMRKGAELTNEEQAALFPRLAEIVRWANDLEAYILGRAMAGTEFQGLKLVEGRSLRKFADEDQVRQRFEDQGFEPEQYLNTKLIPIGEAERLVGKKKFTEVFGDLVVKPEGKPVLVPQDDKRPALGHHDSAVAEMLLTD